MLVLGIPKRNEEFVIKLDGKEVARVRPIKDYRGRMVRVGFTCNTKVRISREPVKDT